MSEIGWAGWAAAAQAFGSNSPAGEPYGDWWPWLLAYHTLVPHGRHSRPHGAARNWHLGAPAGQDATLSSLNSEFQPAILSSSNSEF